MSKEIKILTPRIYEHSDFFHDAVDFAREHSLNTNELCLELSHYLVDNFEKIWKVEKPRVYKKLADLEAKLAEKDSTIKTLIEDSKASKELLKKQLAEKEKEYDIKYKHWIEEIRESDRLREELAKINKEWVQSIHDWKEIVKKKDEEIAQLEEHNMIFHNQLALEQLEKVKNGIESKIKSIYKRLDDLNIKIVCERASMQLDTYKEISKEIDNQIEELKKEK